VQLAGVVSVKRLHQRARDVVGDLRAERRAVDAGEAE
jgi:hypothetical protein